MEELIAALSAAKIVAIVRLERYDRAVEVAQALYAGGITAIEFTLTGAGAFDAGFRVRGPCWPHAAAARASSLTAMVAVAHVPAAHSRGLRWTRAHVVRAPSQSRGSPACAAHMPASLVVRGRHGHGV